CDCSALVPSTDAGVPHMFPKNDPSPAPKMWSGLPKDILNPYRTQTISTRANATKVIIIEFTDQRFCITPPYSTASPGTLISPTSVAAVSCQALSPGLRKSG